MTILILTFFLAGTQLSTTMSTEFDSPHLCMMVLEQPKKWPKPDFEWDYATASCEVTK